MQDINRLQGMQLEPKQSFGRGHFKGYNQEDNFRLPVNKDSRQGRISAIEHDTDTGNN